MTTELVGAIASTDRDQVAKLRGVLVECARDAESGSPRAVLYAALAGALANPTTGIDRGLEGATLAATEQQPDAVAAVAMELIRASTMDLRTALLVATLARELMVAAAAGLIEVARFGDLMRDAAPADLVRATRPVGGCGGADQPTTGGSGADN